MEKCCRLKHVHSIYVLHLESIFPDQPLPGENTKVEVQVTNQNIIHYYL